MATELVLVDIPYPATEVKDDESVVVNRVRALWDFTAVRGDQLEFKAGDVIIVLNQSDECEGWWYGELDEDIAAPVEGEQETQEEGEGRERRRGMFPLNHVEVVEIERLIKRNLRIDRSKVSDRIRLLQMKMKGVTADDESLNSDSTTEDGPKLAHEIVSASQASLDSSSESTDSTATPGVSAPVFEPDRAAKARKMKEARERRRRVMREEAAAKRAEEERAAAAADSDDSEGASSAEGESHSEDETHSDSDNDSEREHERERGDASESESESNSESNSESERDCEGEHELVDDEDVEEEIMNDEGIDLVEEKQWERLAVRQISMSGSDAESSGSDMEVTEDMLNEIRLQRASRRKRIRQQRKRTSSQLRPRDSAPPPTPPMSRRSRASVDSDSDSGPSPNQERIAAVRADSVTHSVVDGMEEAHALENPSQQDSFAEIGDASALSNTVEEIVDDNGREKEKALGDQSTTQHTQGAHTPAPHKKELSDSDVAITEQEKLEQDIAKAALAASDEAQHILSEVKEDLHLAGDRVEVSSDQKEEEMEKLKQGHTEEASGPRATPPQLRARRQAEPARHESNTVWEAVVAGDVEFLRRFLEADEFKVMVNGRNEKGQAVLHLAVIAKQKAVCEMLVREGAAVSVLDRNNCMPHRLAGCTPDIRRAILFNCHTQPTWVPDSTSSTCMLCECKFTFFHRRHHCRNCGVLACSHCCSEKKAIPKLDLPEPVRVCIDCTQVLE